MAIAHIHLGTNQGDLRANLRSAIQKLDAQGTVLDTSHIYETEAWGNEDQPNFYNMALTYDTHLLPHDLLQFLHQIEDELGRVRKEKWGTRSMDLDIITYNREVINDDTLTIPHAHMAKRNFVLVPMIEIAGEWLHPTLDKTLDDIYVECEDTCDVILLDKGI